MTSGFPPEADIVRAGRHVSKVSKAEVADAFSNYLVAVAQAPSSVGHASLQTRLGAMVCFSRLELTLHGSLALSLAEDVVVLPLHTRR
jgi:hypothetical protein